MQHYEIKITGSGTKQEIADSLFKIGDDLLKQEGYTAGWEDETLCMDIDECEPFNENE